MATRACPNCAEQIQEEAVVCRFCGRRLRTRPTVVLALVALLAGGAGLALRAPWDRLLELADSRDPSRADPVLPTRPAARRAPPPPPAGVATETTAPPSPADAGAEPSSGGERLARGPVTPEVLRAIVRVESKDRGTGSGFFVSPDGYLLTSMHVVKDASLVDVELHDGTTETLALVAAEEIGDVALLKLSGRGAVDYLPLADATGPFASAPAIVVGYPRGSHAPVVTRGVIGGRGRSLDAMAPWELFRLTNAVDVGSSGGPVLDLSGRVVAIVTAKATHSLASVSFATPINYASQLPFPGAAPLATPTLQSWLQAAREAGQRPPEFAVPPTAEEAKAVKVTIEGFHRMGKGFAVLLALTDAAGQTVAPRTAIEVRLTWDAVEEDRRLTQGSRCETWLHAGDGDYYAHKGRVVAQVVVDCPELDVDRVTGIRVEASVDGVEEPAVHVE